MSTSNTKECFRECIGLKVKGVLFDALPMGGLALAHGTKTLVFDDGTGLTVSGNGSYWRETKAGIEGAVDDVRARLARAHQDLEDVLASAGRE